MVEKGWLGKKTGKGFFLYPKDAKKGAAKQLNPEMLELLTQIRVEKGFGSKPGNIHCFIIFWDTDDLTCLFSANISIEDIQMRLITRFINEAAYCLQGTALSALSSFLRLH